MLTVDVPGVPEEALSVSVDRTHARSLDVATDELTWNERIRLPHTLDVDATTANYANGRLTVTVPASPEAQPRKVEITVGTPPPPRSTAAGDQPADSATQRHRVTELARQLRRHRQEIPFRKDDERLHR